MAAPPSNNGVQWFVRAERGGRGRCVFHISEGSSGHTMHPTADLQPFEEEPYHLQNAAGSVKVARVALVLFFGIRFHFQSHSTSQHQQPQTGLVYVMHCKSIAYAEYMHSICMSSVEVLSRAPVVSQVWQNCQKTRTWHRPWTSIKMWSTTLVQLMYEVVAWCSRFRVQGFSWVVEDLRSILCTGFHGPSQGKCRPSASHVQDHRRGDFQDYHPT